MTPICTKDGKTCDFRIEYRHYKYVKRPPDAMALCRYSPEYPTHINKCWKMNPLPPMGPGDK